MIFLKTKTAFNAPTQRGFVNTVIYLTIESVEFYQFGVIPKGYYYRLDNENVIKLSDISKSPITWETIGLLEQNLSTLQSNTSLESVFFQRLQEMTIVKLTLENVENYGTNVTDWEFFNPE